MYDEVGTKEHLIAKLYSSRQEESEDITKWSCRLEYILSNAVDRKIVEPETVNEMLTNMFWQGLKPSLKDISGYLVDKMKDFDKLRAEMRKNRARSYGIKWFSMQSKKISNDQELIQSDPISCPQNQKGNN